MKAYEFLFLEMNWHDLQLRLANAAESETLPLTDRCYVVLGTYGLSVFKLRAKKWYRKTVNDWKSLSFQEFYEQFKQQMWEDT